jgi:hypothetical protein
MLHTAIAKYPDEKTDPLIFIPPILDVLGGAIGPAKAFNYAAGNNGLIGRSIAS